MNTNNKKQMVRPKPLPGRHFIITKGSIWQQDTAILNLYMSNNYPQNIQGRN